MRTSFIAAATAVSAMGLLAPAPSFALSVDTPLKVASNSQLLHTGTQVTFNGWVPANFAQASTNQVTNVAITLVGKTGGTIDVWNYSPNASVIKGMPESLSGILSNSVLLSQPNLYQPTTVPASPGGGVPSKTTINVTPMDHTYSWNIWNPGILGVSPFTTAASFEIPLITMPTTCKSDPEFNPGGPFVSTDACTFDLDIAQSFATYTYVPGPLPILGAGAAFGWSRRLRKRISKVA